MLDFIKGSSPSKQGFTDINTSVGSEIIGIRGIYARNRVRGSYLFKKWFQTKKNLTLKQRIKCEKLIQTFSDRKNASIKNTKILLKKWKSNSNLDERRSF